MVCLVRRHAVSPSQIYALNAHSLRRHARSLWTSRLSSPVQSYLSTSTDAPTNLSLEHHLLQHTAPHSTVLLFYTNSPSIILGRNQNPWLETNISHVLPRLHAHHDLALVRRRSGGGTVFHDPGNINWSVILPPKEFKRDTHAEMVVRALRAVGVRRARVNERHDIVLDQGAEAATEDVDPLDTHATPFASSTLRPLKCSGSAFKLTRTRALHHGTCLLRSNNLAGLAQLLRGPGRGVIQALGVESVSSPVGNAGVTHDDFTRAVRREFARMYAPGDAALEHVEVSHADAERVDAIAQGAAELRSAVWTYGQTPRFSVRVRAGEVAELAALAPLSFGVDVEKGKVKRTALARREGENALEGSEAVQMVLQEHVPLYDGQWEWRARIAELQSSLSSEEVDVLAAWMQRILPCAN